MNDIFKKQSVPLINQICTFQWEIIFMEQNQGGMSIVYKSLLVNEVTVCSCRLFNIRDRL